MQRYLALPSLAKAKQACILSLCLMTLLVSIVILIIIILMVTIIITIIIIIVLIENLAGGDGWVHGPPPLCPLRGLRPPCCRTGAILIFFLLFNKTTQNKVKLLFSDGSDTYSTRQLAIQFVGQSFIVSDTYIIPGEKARPAGSLHGSGHSQRPSWSPWTFYGWGHLWFPQVAFTMVVSLCV